MKDYLVFVSASNAAMLPYIHGPRIFDICVHDYSSSYSSLKCPEDVEHYFARPYAEKLETAAQLIPTLPTYKHYAFLDDDLTITADQIDRLFRIGDSLNLDLYQPALSPDSFYSHYFLVGTDNHYVMKVPFVEVMMPFFSKSALDACLPTFDLNVSGWGLDTFMWPARAQPWLINERSLFVGHHRAPARRDRKMRNGLTPMQEFWIMKKIYDPTDRSAPPLI
jgi:hypothetical protein